MTFAAPLFLIAALAGIIPVLLHMVNRQRMPVMPFSTLRFLRLSAEQTRRRKVIQDVLLLLLRVAALVFVALALARPAVSHFGNLLGRSGPHALVIVLDNSASMATADATGPRWQAALRATEVLCDQLADRDRVALLFTCGPPQPETRRLTGNQEVIRQALDSCRVSHETADLNAAVQKADNLLQTVDTANKEIYVVTDMQAVSWTEPRSRGGSDGGTETAAHGDQASPQHPARPPSRTEAPAGAAPVVVVDVHGPPLPNVGLGRVQLAAVAPVAGVPVTATVTVHGDAAVAQHKRVELYVDGAKLAVSPTLELAAGATAEPTFRFTPDQAGVQRGEFRLVGEDACALDDRRYFAVSLDRQLDVALVRIPRPEIRYLEDGYYLDRALRPVRRGPWAIRPTVMTPGQLAAAPLARYVTIFCVNMPALDAPTAQRLREYVTGGGHLVWTSGKAVDPAGYNAMNKLVDGQLLPGRLAATRTLSARRPDPWHVGWLDDRHPALAPLTDPASLYQSVLVRTFVPIAPDTTGGARVLARLDDGSPLLVERSVGAGSILFLATSVHVGWSNLPLRPLFLPLVARLTFYLAGQRGGPTQILAGTPLTIPLPPTPATEVEIIRPAGEAVRLPVRTHSTADNRHTVRYADTHAVGVYRVKTVATVRARPMAFACNLDPAELDPAMLDPARLATHLNGRHPIFCDDPANLPRVVAQLRRGQSLWEVFLVAVLIALVAEPYVANRRVIATATSQPPRLATGDRLRRFRFEPDTIEILSGKPGQASHVSSRTK